MTRPASLDLSPLLARAFFTAEAARATEALGEARAQVEGRSWEIVVPSAPDAAWLEGALLAKLVYFCESTRAPLPGCGNVFVSFFAGDRLCCVAAADVVAFAGEALGLTTDEMVKRYGTGEVRHPLRGD
jgi:hypothetical protein